MRIFVVSGRPLAGPNGETVLCIQHSSKTTSTVVCFNRGKKLPCFGWLFLIVGAVLSKVRRRTFITAAGGSSVAIIAGCLSTDDNDNGPGGTMIPDERVDSPPHDPQRPPPPDEDEQWDDHWPGSGMAAEPSLSFEQTSAPLVDRQLGGSPPPARSEYAATLVTSDEELADWINLESAPERLQSVNFDSEHVVIVESGYGSSSVWHTWQRIEERDSGVYLHGYYTVPYIQTDDHTARHSVVVVNQAADADDIAHVSLTTAEDTRVNFDSTEGVVSIENNEE